MPKIYERDHISYSHRLRRAFGFWLHLQFLQSVQYLVSSYQSAENKSPRSRRAKKAFDSNDTAPSGARMTVFSYAGRVV